MDSKDLISLSEEASNRIDFYSKLYANESEDFDSINSIDDFRDQIPRTSKDILLQKYEGGSFDMGSENVDEGVYARPTSGTTSEMACYYRQSEEMEQHRRRFRNSASHFFSTGKNSDRIVVATTFSLAPIMTQQFMELDCVVTCASPLDLSRTVEVITTMKANTIVCSPAIAVKLTEKLEEKEYKGLEKFYLISSGLTPLVESKIRDTYPNIEIMLQYGLAETGILLEQCQHLTSTNKYHKINDENIHVEFLNEDEEEIEEGEIGDIVVTKSGAFPLIRYEVGDLFEKESKCSCGKISYRFVGRKSDRIKIKGATLFTDRIEKAMKPLSEYINLYQVEIDEIDEDIPKPKIRLLVEPESSKIDQEMVENTFSENFNVANNYSWSKGVESGLFAPIEVEFKEFNDRKIKKVKDIRYE